MHLPNKLDLTFFLLSQASPISEFVTTKTGPSALKEAPQTTCWCVPAWTVCLTTALECTFSAATSPKQVHLLVPCTWCWLAGPPRHGCTGAAWRRQLHEMTAALPNSSSIAASPGNDQQPSTVRDQIEWVVLKREIKGRPLGGLLLKNWFCGRGPQTNTSKWLLDHTSGRPTVSRHGRVKMVVNVPCVDHFSVHAIPTVNDGAATRTLVLQTEGHHQHCKSTDNGGMKTKTRSICKRAMMICS